MTLVKDLEEQKEESEGDLDDRLSELKPDEQEHEKLILPIIR